ncbi:MAG: alpha/beta hydrolase [Planctomycetota bacterium]
MLIEKFMNTPLLLIPSVVLIAYLVLCLIVFFMQSRFVYFPTQRIEYTPEDIKIDFEDITFESNDGLKLNGWYIPAHSAEFTILFCHGNGGNISHRLDSISLFNRLGLSCFIFDYRGYGISEGKPSEEGTYLDALAAYNWLCNQKELKPENIIIFGRSLGASVASHLAIEKRCKSLILESAFTSVAEIGSSLYPYMPIRLLARYKYSTIDYVKTFDGLVMVIHSRDDEIIPFEFGVKLYEASKKPKKFIEISGTHNEGFITSGDVYVNAWKEWITFLRDYEAKVPKQ